MRLSGRDFPLQPHFGVNRIANWSPSVAAALIDLVLSELFVFGAMRTVHTRALRMLETHHAPTCYLPLQEIQATLRPAQGSSFCEWKGVARYFDVLAGSATAPRAACL